MQKVNSNFDFRSDKNEKNRYYRNGRCYSRRYRR